MFLIQEGYENVINWNYFAHAMLFETIHDYYVHEIHFLW
jgi:hypothetical protein